MDEKKAIEIIKMLADGIDPNTGEVFPADSPYQNVDIVRALHTAEEALKRVSKLDNRIRNLPERAGKPWESEESDLLAQRFDSGMPITEIAKAHNRTKGAIAARLVRLGKIESRDEAFMKVRPDGL
jgi:hypothetical protein